MSTQTRTPAAIYEDIGAISYEHSHDVKTLEGRIAYSTMRVAQCKQEKQLWDELALAVLNGPAEAYVSWQYAAARGAAEAAFESMLAHEDRLDRYRQQADA